MTFQFEIEVENFSFTFENLGDHCSILLSLLVFEFKLRTLVLLLRIWELIFQC